MKNIYKIDHMCGQSIEIVILIDRRSLVEDEIVRKYQNNSILFMGVYQI